MRVAVTANSLPLPVSETTPTHHYLILHTNCWLFPSGKCDCTCQPWHACAPQGATWRMSTKPSVHVKSGVRISNHETSVCIACAAAVTQIHISRLAVSGHLFQQHLQTMLLKLLVTWCSNAQQLTYSAALCMLALLPLAMPVAGVPFAPLVFPSYHAAHTASQLRLPPCLSCSAH